MPTMEALALPQLHSLEVPKASGLVVVRSGYKPEVAYEQVRLGLSQVDTIAFVGKYNHDNKLEGDSRIRLASPDIEYELSELGREHAAFNNQFERDGKRYIVALTDTQLRKPGHDKEYKEGKVWRRDVWQYNDRNCLWEKVAEGQKVPASGVILTMDKALGVPTKTIGSYEHTPVDRNHWYFDSNLDEVALARGRDWGGARIGCLLLSAGLRPGDSCDDFGFRPVRGSVASYVAREAPKSIKPKETRNYASGYKDGKREGFDEGYGKAQAEFLRKLDKFRKGLQ